MPADDDALADTQLNTRAARRRQLQAGLEAGPEEAAVETEIAVEVEPEFEVEEALPDEILNRLAARKGLSGAAATPPPSAVAPCFDDLDVSALIASHLETRATRRRPGNPRVLAMRAMRGAERLAREADPTASARPAEDLADRLLASLTAAGEAPRLEAAAASLASGEVARRMTGLAASVRRLVPAEVDLAALAQEGAKQAIMNTLNPAVAASFAAADTARRMNALRGWATMPPRERVAHVAALGANLADLLGAFTPPPTGAAAQALGAGLGLVALASEPRVGRRRAAAAPNQAEANSDVAPAPATVAPPTAPPAAATPLPPRSPIPPRATGPLPPRGRTGALPPPPPRSKTGDLPPPPAPRPPGTGLLQDRRDNLAHNLGDRAQGVWARISKRLDEVKPLLNEVKPLLDQLPGRSPKPPSDDTPPT